MNSPGVLLDTGPIVGLLSQDDSTHARAKALFAECTPPFRCCEAVIAEACFLINKVHSDGPAEVISLGRKGFYEVSLPLAENWNPVETLLRKYKGQPISLADACLIRCAEIYKEARILTFDSDFRIYRWAKNKKFEILSA